MLFKALRKPGSKDMKASADAFTYFEYGMTIGGWLPPTRGRKLYMIFRAFIVLFAIVYMPIGFIISYTKDIKSYSPGELLTSLQACINDFGCSVRVLILYSYLSIYQKAKDLLDRLDEYCLDGADRYRVQYWVKRCNILYIIYLSVYSNYGVTTFLAATFNGATPWGVYNPIIDSQSSTTNLWIASSLEFIIFSFAILQQQLIDVFGIIYCLMLRVHIGILQERVSKLRTDPEETEQRSYEELVKCIEHYKLILEYANLIRSLISRITFVQFLLIGLILGCTLVNLFFFSNFWSGLACVVYLSGVIAQTFPFCYICDLVKEDCNRLSIAIFQSNWIGSSRRYKTSLIQFLFNAQQSISYTAGSIFPISVETNIKVAKLAFSVVTFVKKMNIAEKLMKD